ncbi:hypothetical protein CRE_16034 [Caenorhabditis remanei]|uniref:Serpentine receptor class gamma n=1 Tax=Caenorhabditis remanei TaxID=31234 RepID=E3MBG3_CAERE|nr:hypothetical protein CRE_16034 [Caenorhabditis remanei]
MYLGSILFAIIGMFSFSAAIQRIVIFYWPKYKFLVRGKWLNYEICLVYVSVIHYSYTALRGIHSHLWTFSKIENMDRGTYLLYQFTPIHSLLMLHSVAHFVGLLIEDRGR